MVATEAIEPEGTANVESNLRDSRFVSTVARAWDAFMEAIIDARDMHARGADAVIVADLVRDARELLDIIETEIAEHPNRNSGRRWCSPDSTAWPPSIVGAGRERAWNPHLPRPRLRILGEAPRAPQSPAPAPPWPRSFDRDAHAQRLVMPLLVETKGVSLERRTPARPGLHSNDGLGNRRSRGRHDIHDRMADSIRKEGRQSATDDRSNGSL